MRLGFSLGFHVDDLEIRARLLFHLRYGIFLTWNLYDEHGQAEPKFLRGDPTIKRVA